MLGFYAAPMADHGWRIILSTELLTKFVFAYLRWETGAVVDRMLNGYVPVRTALDNYSVYKVAS
ncbi:MAG: hypothetical protein ACLPY5_13940 [Candidatus Bathyarchaeia archaeon]